MRELKRRWRFFINGLKEKWEYILLVYDQYMCIHYYRPAAINNKPGQVCKFCEKSELLTPEEYYSVFGEKNWRQWD